MTTPSLCQHDDPSWCTEECRIQRAVFEQWMYDEGWVPLEEIMPWHVRVIIWWQHLRLRVSLWLRS